MPSSNEILNIVAMQSDTQEVGVVQDSVVCASYLEVFVDHGRNLSVTDESFFHQGLLLFQTDSVLEVEVHDDLFQGRCISCFKNTEQSAVGSSGASGFSKSFPGAPNNFCVSSYGQESPVGNPKELGTTW